GRESQNWQPPSDKDLIRGPEVNVPDVTCRSVGDAEAILRSQGFETRVDSVPVDSACAAGQVAGTTPSGVTSPGDTITIQISNGSGFQPEPNQRPAPGPGPGDPGGPGGDNGGGDRSTGGGAGGGSGGGTGGGGSGGGGAGGSQPTSEPPPAVE